PNYVPKTDLIAWMPFSGNSKDVSANANSNTVNGATLSTDRNNISNESYSFDGVDDYIELGGISSKLNASKGLTMSAWILWGGSGGYVFIIAPKPNGYITIGSDSTIGINVLNCNCSTDIDIKHKIKPNQWYHIALTYDISQGKMSLYCDGKLISTKYENIYSYYSMNGSNSRLGNYYFNNHYFKGKIDEVGLWNRELNSCEINLLFLGKNVDPEIKAVPAKKVTYKSAILSTLVNPYLDTATLSFEYGLTTNYGQSAFVETISQSCSNGYYSKQVENLLSGKLYHYRVKVKTSSKTYYGEDQLLTTGSNFGESESSSHNVFLGDNGIVYAVGDNSAGQLGDNSKTSKNVPIKVLKGEYDGCKYLGDNPRNPIISVGSGAGYTLALALDGTLYSFGDNTYGQLGINSTTSQITPVRVLMGEYVGTKYIGDNNNNPIVEISCGEEFIAVVDKQGLVYSWGRNTFGQLGDNSLTGKKIPVKVRKGTYSGTIYLGDQLNNPIVQIEAGDNFCIAQSADGLLYAWGSNSNGQLGDNTLTDRTEPIIALKGSYDGTKYIGDNPKISITNISAGGAFSSCVLSNGRVLGWGKNDYGQLGCNSTTDQKIPVNTDKGDYSGISFIGDKIGNRVIQVVNGNHFKLMLTENGNLFSVGLNANGQLGLNSTTTSFLTPKRVLKGSYVGATYLGDDTLNKISNIAAGGAQSFAVLNSGLVFSCGFNDVGQLAIGSSTNSLVPAKVKDGISTNGQLDLIDMLQLVKNRFLGDDISICNKDSIRVSASAKMKSYSWNISSTNQTITIKKSGIYECSQTDSSGCIWKDTIVVSILNPKINPIDTVVCKGGFSVLSVKNTSLSSIKINSTHSFVSGIYTYHIFYNDSSIQITNPESQKLDYLILGGGAGGSGGKASVNYGAGGAGGNIVFGSFNPQSGVYNLKVGRGGTAGPFNSGSGGNGGFSSIFKDTAWGGSGPSFSTTTGGSNKKYSGGTNGGFTFNTGGGAGAGGNGYNASGGGAKQGGKGGDGFSSDFTGKSIVYGGGGAGGIDGLAQINGGGGDASNYYRAGGNGVNTRGGGGGGGAGGYAGGAGGSGIVIIRYLTNPVTTKWSTGDTTSSIKYSTSGKNKVWVRVSDGLNQCSDTTTISIFSPSIQIGQKDTIKNCGIDSIQISASPGFKSYLWSTGKSGKSIYVKQTGYLSVTGTDSLGCKASDSALIS
ncbi:MAG: hypothetical protein RL737_611, partial [Bacteroidota bacterium]